MLSNDLQANSVRIEKNIIGIMVLFNMLVLFVEYKRRDDDYDRILFGGKIY